MVKHYHLENGHLTEITEGEYIFRIRKHTDTEPSVVGLGEIIKTHYGVVFAAEVGNAKRT